MTDMIPADKVRPIVAAMRAAMRRDDDTYRDADFLADMSGYISDMEALLPLPTMADMTDEERAACQWMQADVRGHSVRHVIANAHDRAHVRLFSPDGESDWMYPDLVTPRPDLPRLEWPGEDPVPPDPLAEGSEWDDADALTLACRESGRDQITMIDCDGDVFVWDAGAEWWETGFPSYGFEPFTILHAGREADQ